MTLDQYQPLTIVRRGEKARIITPRGTMFTERRRMPDGTGLPAHAVLRALYQLDLHFPVQRDEIRVVP